MLKKALLLVSGNAFGSAMLLIRNLAVARLVSVENYGIAATFATSMAIVEMLSQFGLQQMIVQDKNGDDPDLQAGLQGFNLFRGALAGLALFAIAGPYARFLGIDDVAWAYQVMALVPVINGLIHFDIHRLKRHMKFMPSILSSVIPATVSLLAVWPFAIWFADYRVMLYSLIVQALVTVATSHALAERPYRMTMRRDLTAQSMRFGWPLLINAVLLFAVFNGEKLIIGRELGMVALGIFSMGFTLTLTPTLVLAGSAQSFFLPQLSAVQDNPSRMYPISYATFQSSLAIGLLLVMGVVVMGPPISDLLLGPHYAALLPLLAPLAVVQALRVCKAGSAVVALSRAQTGNSLIANLFRVLSLPISWWVAVTTGDILQILWIAAAAELAGYAASLYLVRIRLKLPLKRMLWPVSLTLGAFLATLADSILYLPQTSFIGHLHLFQLVVLGFGFAALASMTDLRTYILRRGR